MNTLEWNEAALAKYLATHPTLKDEISALSPKEQKQQLQWAFEDEAEPGHRDLGTGAGTDCRVARTVAEHAP